MNKPSLLYSEAFTEYIGNIEDIVRQPLPYRCLKCHEEMGSMEQVFIHIRSMHDERLVTESQRKRKEEKEKEKEQS